jgi:CubicO group peptidase (beta-lactamase class C family)
MMKSVFGFVFILLLAIGLNTSAQNRQLQKTDSVFRLIKKHIKTKDADSIYALAGIEYKSSIRPDIFKNELFGKLFPFGAIKKDSLISFVNNRKATYKVQLDAVSMLLSIELDESDKIGLFFFQPYQEVHSNKPAIAASTNPLKTTLDKQVDSVAQIYIKKSNTTGLSIGIIKDGKTIVYNYGETAKGNKKLPNGSSIFEIGSITKTFTASVLAWYVNEGRIKLSDPIIKYLPDSIAHNPALKNITLANLSNHTSGLTGLPTNLQQQNPYDRLSPYKNYTKQLLFAYLKSCALKSEPGQKYAYSNLAVGLLGTILEEVSGKSFEQMVSEIICKPLGMKTTVQHLYPLIATRFVTVYNENGEETPSWDFDALASCGSLRSTVNDLLLYTKANMYKDATKLSKAFELAHTVTFDNGDTKIGLGWHIIKVAGVSYYYHNGGTYGSSSFLAYNTPKNIAVVILSNTDESTDVLGGTLLRKLSL